jgi:hypothetical protein
VVSFFIFILPISIIIIVILGVLWVITSDKKKWNRGICSKCNSEKYQSFDVCSGGGTGYKCHNCKDTWWSSGWINFKEIESVKQQVRTNQLEELLDD